jgi:uncharacterized phage protein (TIGR02218 family)
MKPASPALVALLASDQFVFADLYTFTLRGGLVLRYTSADIDVTYGGHVFKAGGELSGYSLVQGGRMRVVKGLEVDTTTITIAPGTRDRINGLPMLTAIRQGFFDRCAILKQRVFMASWGDTSAGAIIIFSGEAADIKPGRTSCDITVKSDIYLLNVAMPRNVYQASCMHGFGDAGCGVNRANYAVSLAVASTAVSTTQTIYCPIPGAVDAYDGGTIAFTSGVNAGLSRSIHVSSPGFIQTYSAFPNAPAAGDMMTVTPGCDKTMPSFGSTSVTQYLFTLVAAAPGWAADLGVTMTIPGTTTPGYWKTLGGDGSPYWVSDALYGGWVMTIENVIGSDGATYDLWSNTTNDSIGQTTYLIPRGANLADYITGGHWVIDGSTTTVWIPGTTATPDTVISMQQVVSSPGPGQYAIDSVNGWYLFNGADSGKLVTIAYEYQGGTGCGKFRNMARFKACPFVPVPETST